MNYVKRPKEEKVVLRMQQLYLKTERKLINEITRKRALGQVDYAEVAALERVQKILTDMQSEAFEYVPQMVETIFHGEGEKNAAGYANARTLTTAQIDVSQTLINNLLGEIVEASNTALESATTWLSIGRLEGDEFRNAALQFTAEQQAMGASWQMAQKNMAVDLQARGITAFVDKAGRQWSLTDYCTMATRTTARQASVAANLTRDDHDLWQISRIGSTCPVCAVYEGRVYSKSGTNPDYPPLAAAFGKIDPYGPNDLTNTYLNIHPNCLHSLMKYTTIGKSDKEIQRDKDFSSFEKNPITHDPRTKKQIAAYREKERNRRRYIDDYKQWRKYKAAFGKDIPDFETFRAHKLKDDDKYKEWLHKFRSFRAKGVDIPGQDDIIIKNSEKVNGSLAKALSVEEFNDYTRGRGIDSEALDIISSTIKDYEKKGGMMFSEAVFGLNYNIPGVTQDTILQTDISDYGLTILRINKEWFEGKTLEVINKIISKSTKSLPKNLKEAVIHECGHAKAYYKKNREQIEQMNDELKNRGVGGISEIAGADGAECIAETEVLLYRNSPVPQEAMALYREYVKGCKV